MKSYTHIAAGIIMSLFISACEEPYDPEVNPSAITRLVVDGVLIDSTTEIRLTQSGMLQSSLPMPEQGARVWVESEAGNYISPYFDEEAPGRYRQDLDLETSQKYRLIIETEDGKRYESAYVDFKESPPVGEIDFSVFGGDVQYYVSTRDPNNSTRFYRWEYEETWQYHSAFESYWRYRDGEMFFLPQSQQTYRCWTSQEGEEVLIASTANLTDDVVSKKPLLTIDPSESGRLSVRYSLLVKQYALTEEAFDFWKRLKQNTEKLGTLFDPLPAQLPTNIQCVTHPEEEVIGFISASSVSTKRVFNVRGDFPVNFFYNPVRDCVQQVLPLPRGIPSLAEWFEDSTTYIPIDTVPGNSDFWYASSPFCIDCRQRGGSIKKPDFW